MGILPYRWRRIGEGLLDRASVRPLDPAARVWRRCLYGARVVAITGSVGKTTCRRLLAAALSAAAPTLDGARGDRATNRIAESVLALRPRHRFAVFEISGDAPGVVRLRATIARPDVAVVLAVASSHLQNFPSLQAIANEKATLIDALPTDGVALLNADDPLVRAMAGRGDRRCVLFGRALDAEVRAVEVSGVWPGRLSFAIATPEGRWPVRTQLVGEHWLPSVLAALAAARACGLAMPEAIAAIAVVPPSPARMEPMDLPSGATLLRDEFDGTRDTWDPALRVLREARIDGRRWLIAGDFSDSKKRARRRASEVGRLAAESADGAIFVGERAEHAVQAAIEAGMPAGAAESCYSCEDAAELVRQRLRRGDLALLKGRHTEHLSRIALAQIATVDCRRTDCSRLLLCDVCPDLRAAGKVDPSSGVESD